ncbi:MAG TPA: hypothetical protein VG225_07470 [Terracidiphilus sp.]|jgi:hypothetical protein|nr:hypothetical protein [Terracidiphilus sp.]
MKRWQWFALLFALVALGAYFYFYRGVRPGGNAHPSAAGGSADAADYGRPATMNWQTVSRSDDGFRLEMPADPRDLQVPAYNETGGSEPVKMLFSIPDGDTTFAISWEDNPPVARVNDRVPERTLDQARDGMLARTQTTLVGESRVSALGYPARDITAKNSEGGVLDARLIFMNDRLYTLMALFPSMGARREQDVTRFYNSFTPLRVGTAIPAGPAKGNA